ncbi:MAG: ABC transporter ATP-binding protein [Thermodesulfobacteriota bacterium]
MSLVARGLGFSRGGREVLCGVDLTVEPGQALCVVGPNGAGKTTLLRCLQGLLRNSRGEVAVDGRPVRGMAPRDLARYLAYVPQSGPSRLALTVFDLVLAGRRPHLGWRPAARDLDAVQAVLEEFGIADLAGRDLDELSGGQRQKASLARAFAQEPRYLLLDEPTSSLDVRSQLEVMELLRRALAQHRVGAVLAIHDLNLARRYADAALLLDSGRPAGCGDPCAVLSPGPIRAVYGVDMACVPVNGCSALFALGPAQPPDNDNTI